MPHRATHRTAESRAAAPAIAVDAANANAELAPRKRRGRPPQDEPRTSFGRWMRRRDLRSGDIIEMMRTTALTIGIPTEFLPSAKSIPDLASGRYAPSPPVMLVIRHLTGGAIDVEHWVNDVYVAR